jgi:hypothetical protein
VAKIKRFDTEGAKEQRRTQREKDVFAGGFKKRGKGKFRDARLPKKAGGCSKFNDNGKGNR